MATFNSMSINLGLMFGTKTDKHNNKVPDKVVANNGVHIIKPFTKTDKQQHDHVVVVGVKVTDTYRLL